MHVSLTRAAGRAATLGLVLAVLVPHAPATAAVTSAAPTISGTPVVGESLLADSADPDARFQWLSDGSPISGANDRTFTPRPSEANQSLSVAVTSATTTDDPVLSAPTLRVATVTTPTISGQTRVGGTVTASTGTWSPDTTFAFRWFAGDLLLGTTSSRTWIVPSSAKDLPLTVEAVGTSTGYPTVSRRSVPTTRIMLAGSPTIAGTYAVGSTLSAKPGTWSSGVTLTYRWFVDGKPMSGATGATHKIASTQGSRTIRVDVTGTKAGYATVVKPSATSAKVFTAAPVPSISGTRAVGRTLTLVKGSWMSGATTNYRWYANGAPISGASRSTYTLTSGTAGKQISVNVAGRRTGYATVTRSSSRTAKIQRIGSATLGGSSVATHRLSARPGTWVSGTRFTYAWYLGSTRISGATSSSIYVKPSWAGKRLSARVTGRLSGYGTYTTSTNTSRAVALPSRTSPASSWDCPSWAPIKGNASSMIYHKPGQTFYTRTKPEVCFRTDDAARDAGYRKAKV